MKVAGFNLRKISIKRKENTTEEMKISQNIDIKDVSKENIPITNEDVLNIKFSFQINYANDFANVEFEGLLIVIPDKEEIKKFMDSWKDKQLPDGARTPLFNFIMNKCNIRALALEDELNLPPHIPMPKLSAQNQQPLQPEPTNDSTEESSSDDSKKDNDSESDK
ncbi:hypothetical protein HOD75_00040 [archaeon]|jgi:hypothetical protein|nr:hypothetical protein [archaeon]MBT4241266.1 hypothetical protein [archaeon]MBT4418088.1 hypothetical protein [archaeon]